MKHRSHWNMIKKKRTHICVCIISMADISLKNKVSPWERRWDLVSLAYSWDSWKNCFFAQYEHYTPILYERYIDDIVGAALFSEKEVQCFIDHVTNIYSSIKYTYTISSSTVTFHDLQSQIDNNHIKSFVHSKPSDSRNYHLFSASHLPSCKYSIPFSQNCKKTLLFSQC